MRFDELYTERLILRIITPEVLDYAYNYLSDWQVMELMGFSSEAVLQREKEKYNKGLTTFNKSFLYFILTDRADQKVIGWCGYHTWYIDHNRAELGYGLYYDDYKQHGLMSEALKEILVYGFRVMALHRIEAFTATNNTASIKTLQKFGFRQEATLREHYLVNGKMEDSLLFSLLKIEFNHGKN
ncbi:GNAT family N-acetyltransferase [Flavobacterium rhizosphaerae]|uniref:GNAT family protein n=1 Tax=Flavobacterium rhizosphaerae TaxID=3163298 RepID=A0ABW8Z2C0_9FLAO